MDIQTVFIVGPRAAGKTSLGALLAGALGWTFRDTDLHLQQRAGLSVAEIVEREGWEGFRRRESEALRAVAAPGVVVGTGGGMVLAAENREFMRRNGQVLYLTAAPDVLAARLAADPNAAQRPTLTGRSIVEEVAEILATRDRLYRDAAHHLLDASLPLDDLCCQALDLCAAGSPGDSPTL